MCLSVASASTTVVGHPTATFESPDAPGDSAGVEVTTSVTLEMSIALAVLGYLACTSSVTGVNARSPCSDGTIRDCVACPIEKTLKSLSSFCARGSVAPAGRPTEQRRDGVRVLRSDRSSPVAAPWAAPRRSARRCEDRGGIAQAWSRISDPALLSDLRATRAGLLTPCFVSERTPHRARKAAGCGPTVVLRSGCRFESSKGVGDGDGGGEGAGGDAPGGDGSASMSWFPKTIATASSIGWSTGRSCPSWRRTLRPANRHGSRSRPLRCRLTVDDRRRAAATAS